MQKHHSSNPWRPNTEDSLRTSSVTGNTFSMLRSQNTQVTGRSKPLTSGVTCDLIDKQSHTHKEYVYIRHKNTYKCRVKTHTQIWLVPQLQKQDSNTADIISTRLLLEWWSLFFKLTTSTLGTIVSKLCPLSAVCQKSAQISKRLLRHSNCITSRVVTTFKLKKSRIVISATRDQVPPVPQTAAGGLCERYKLLHPTDKPSNEKLRKSDN